MFIPPEIWTDILFHLPFSEAWRLRTVCTAFNEILHNEVILEKFHLISRTANREVALVEHYCTAQFARDALWQRRIGTIRKITFYTEFRSYILQQFLLAVRQGWLGIHLHLFNLKYNNGFDSMETEILHQLKPNVTVKLVVIDYDCEILKKGEKFIKRGYNMNIMLQTILKDLCDTYGYHNRYRRSKRNWEFILKLKKILLKREKPNVVVKHRKATSYYVAPLVLILAFLCGILYWVLIWNLM